MRSRRLRPRLDPWGQATLTFVVAAFALAVVNAPSPSLFAGLVAGAVAARARSTVPQLPESARSFGLAVVGAAAGAQIDVEVLETVAAHPWVVFGGVFVTLAISMAVGQLLRFGREVSASTAVFASIAGGASGVSVVADEFGADVATVMAIQYLRVVIVLVSVPFVAGALETGHAAQPTSGNTDGSVESLLFAAVALTLGLVLGRLARFSASGILMPLAVAGLLASSGLFSDPELPGWLVALGYATVGISVGLGLGGPRLRAVVRLLPLALLETVVAVACCAFAGLAFAEAAGVSRLDGYLATSPGGLPAVIAVALDSSADVGLVLSMQVMRVLVALLCARAVGWWMATRTT